MFLILILLVWESLTVCFSVHTILSLIQIPRGTGVPTRVS